MQKLSRKEQIHLFLQTAFGFTKQEVIILLIFLTGGIMGMIVRRTGTISLTGLRTQEGIQRANHIIDSILKAEDARVDSVLAGSMIHDSSNH
jgi:hypothetical protein